MSPLDRRLSIVSVENTAKPLCPSLRIWKIILLILMISELLTKEEEKRKGKACC